MQMLYLRLDNAALGTTQTATTKTKGAKAYIKRSLDCFISSSGVFTSLVNVSNCFFRLFSHGSIKRNGYRVEGGAFIYSH